MKIKKDDTVKVITGKDAGKTGKVLAAYPKTGKIIVEGVNIQTKHARARQDQPAEIRKVEGPIDASNVMYYDTKSKTPSRLGYTTVDGKKKRVVKKTNQVID